MIYRITYSVAAITTSLVIGQLAHSQGTVTYVSSLDQTSAGSEAVGSDSWVAAVFSTGGNVGGYVLNSVELAMSQSSGVPDDFTVMLYSSGSEFSATPVSLLATLSGPSDPENAGVYTYDASGVVLDRSTPYFIVVTAGTPVSSGAYDWSYADSAPSVQQDLWQGSDTLITSANGTSWSLGAGDPQLAITATPVPEPTSLVLLGLPGLFVVFRRSRSKFLRHS